MRKIIRSLTQSVFCDPLQLNWILVTSSAEALCDWFTHSELKCIKQMHQAAGWLFESLYRSYIRAESHDRNMETVSAELVVMCLDTLWQTDEQTNQMSELSCCRCVFQSGEAVERPDKRGERGRAESRWCWDVVMIHHQVALLGDEEHGAAVTVFRGDRSWEDQSGFTSLCWWTFYVLIVFCWISTTESQHGYCCAVIGCWSRLSGHLIHVKNSWSLIFLF